MRSPRDEALLFSIGDGHQDLGYEGGYSSDPNDKGGETFRGISRVMHPGWMGWEKIDSLKSFLEFPSCAIYDGALADMVREFYVKEFWERIHGEELPGKMAVTAFDFAINSGVDRATRILQISLGVAVDGNIGPKTIKAAYDAGESGIISYLARRAKYLHEIMDNDPTQQVWALNWFRRLFKLANIVLVGDSTRFEPFPYTWHDT